LEYGVLLQIIGSR